MKRYFPVILIFSFSLNLNAFDAGEHAILGDSAFSNAFDTKPNQIKNLEAKLAYRYGQLVAMSGDMYKSIEELALDEPKLLKDYYMHNRKQLKRCIDKEVNSIKQTSEYTKCSELTLIKRKFRYLTLAHDNYTHFAWHNIKTYIEFHQRALWFAKLAYLKCTKKQLKKKHQECKANQQQIDRLVNESPYQKRLSKSYKYFKSVLSRRKLTKDYLKKQSKSRLMDLALFANAYADHFLTDAFSAGHLRIPRSQIDDFVEKSDAYAQIKTSKQKREEGSIISGALTQYLHNLDGHLAGIPVKNSRGDSFLIRGDKQLFSALNTTSIRYIDTKPSHIRIAAEAVSLSLLDIKQMVETGEKPKRYKALELVPFIDPVKAPSLIVQVSEHVKKSGSISKATKSMSSEMRNLFKTSALFLGEDYKTVFQQFVDELPLMLESLRQQITKELELPVYQGSIPKPLASALKSIQ
jgi:hypothetical protein